MDAFYCIRFRQANIGPKLVGLAKHVHHSGVILKASGAPLTGPAVARLTQGELVLAETDTRQFLDEVAQIGGWEENANYKAIMEFLAEDHSSAVETPPQDASDRNVPPRQPTAAKAVRAAPRKRPVAVASPQTSSADAFKASVREVPPSAQRPKVPAEHPRVPGMRLRNGYYWNPAWG